MADARPESPLVLQIGDTAGVAPALSSALREHAGWRVEEMPLSQPSRSGALARAVEWPRRAFSARQTVSEAVARWQPDIVHLHWARFAPFVASSSVPLVIHAHGSDVRGRAATVTGRIVAASLRRASQVLVSTPDLLAHVPAGALYLPNPVDIELFSPVIDREPTDERPRLVLLFSQLTEVKGAPTLIEAARLILRASPATRVAAFAGGTHDAAAQAVGVELLARRGRSELARVLSSADVVVGQQRLGALGLSELEAMATQRPVVMRLDRDLYPHEVPVITVRDAEDLAHRCLQLLEDRVAAAALAARARDYVVRFHSAPVVGRELRSIYEALM